MEPLRPELYLDPLLPLSVRRNPVVIPSVAGTAVRGLLVCSAGKYLVLHGGQTLSPPAPSLTRVDFAAGPALRRPGKSHGSGARTEGWLIVIGGRLLDQLIVGAFGDPGFSRFLDELDSPGSSPCDEFDRELDSHLTELDEELSDRRPAYRVRARSLLTNVLLLLYRSTLTTPELSNGDGLRLGAVIDHIELHYAEALSLAELADLMGTSPSYFSRLFRSEVGMPLFEYINRTRVRKACVLLRNPDLSVTRIAFDVGYNSVSFFNRYFRRIMNSSPREYRRYLSS